MHLSVSPPHLLAEYCAKQLASQGVEISQERLEVLKEKFSVPLSELTSISLDWPDVDESRVSLSFDSKEVLEFAQDRIGEFEEFIRKTIDSTARYQYGVFKVAALELTKSYQRDSALLAADRQWMWGDAIDFLTCCVCANETFATDAVRRMLKWRRGHERTRKTTLLRLHSRVCQVAKEVIALIEAGFADGAYARWRSLHEIRVTAEFLSIVDAVVSQTYVDHLEVGRLKAMYEMEKRDQVAGRRRTVSKRTVTKQKKTVEDLARKWGASFREENGWAASALGKPRLTFRDIEEFATQGNGRLHYKLASQQVHAHEFAFHSRPSTLALFGDYCLTGPSNLGLNEPARLTAFTIMQLSLLLLGDDSDLDSIVVSKCLLKLTLDTEKAFEEVARGCTLVTNA